MVALLAAALLCQQPAASTRPDSVMPYPTRSPGLAVLLSALVPAGGQAYTGNWWKVPIIAPVEVGLGWLALREHGFTSRASAIGDTAAYTLHRDRRATWLFLTGAALALSMTDAYVSAQMYGFDRQMRLSLGPGRFGIEVAFDP